MVKSSPPRMPAVGDLAGETKSGRGSPKELLGNARPTSGAIYQRHHHHHHHIPNGLSATTNFFLFLRNIQLWEKTMEKKRFGAKYEKANDSIMASNEPTTRIPFGKVEKGEDGKREKIETEPGQQPNIPPLSDKLEDRTSRQSIDSTESYNPFEHRNVAKTTSDFGALAHLLKTSLGTGILAMPMAFKNAGLILGAVGTLLLGVLCTHCIQLLVNTSQVLAKRKKVPSLNFEKTAEAAFETGPKTFQKWARTVKNIITCELLFSFLLGNTVYVVFMSQTMKQVVEFHWAVKLEIRLYVLMLWFPLICMCLFRNLKSLVPFSIAANTFVVISFSITLYYIFRDIRKTDSVKNVASIERLPLFLSTVIFAIEGIGTVLPIENEMRNPQNFLGKGRRWGVVHIAMSIVITLYAFIGFFGYLEYGEETKGSITLNLPVQDELAQVVKLLIGLAIFFTYALQFYVPINIVLSMTNPKTPKKWVTVADVGVRAGLVTLTVIVAIIIPNLEPIISLVGAISFSMLGLLLPALLDTVMRWPNHGRLRWRLYKNYGIIALSIIALLSGTYASVIDLIQVYS